MTYTGGRFPFAYPGMVGPTTPTNGLPPPLDPLEQTRRRLGTDFERYASLFEDPSQAWLPLTTRPNYTRTGVHPNSSAGKDLYNRWRTANQAQLTNYDAYLKRMKADKLKEAGYEHKPVSQQTPVRSPPQDPMKQKYEGLGGRGYSPATTQPVTRSFPGPGSLARNPLGAPRSSYNTKGMSITPSLFSMRSR